MRNHPLHSERPGCLSDELSDLQKELGELQERIGKLKARADRAPPARESAAA